MPDEIETRPDFKNLVRILAAQTKSQIETEDAKAASEASAISDGEYEEIQRRKAETAGLRERNKDRRINRKLRSGYAKSVLCYLVWYSAFVGALLILSGFKICGFSLPEAVLSFLVGSTAAAAIGLVYAVTNGLFNGIGKD